MDHFKGSPDADDMSRDLEELDKSSTKLMSGTEQDDVSDDVVTEHDADNYLIYGVNDNPPLHITIVCALQQGLLSLSSHLMVSLLVAEAVCASDNELLKARLLSSTLFMSGVTTIVMNLFGVRLPLFQGAAHDYVSILLIVAQFDRNFCARLPDHGERNSSAGNFENSTLNMTTDDISMDRIIGNIQALQGSLALAGIIHALLGFTGFVGIMLKFIGPLTVIPTMVLMFIFVVTPILGFVQVNWGIAMSTVTVAVILFLYLGNNNMPVPIWTPSGGFRIIRYPLHQVFAILISIVINWTLCGLLTRFGVLTDDPKNIGYNARTDARSEIIRDNPWFTFPYPGQYGPFRFSGAAFLSCMIATFISILDSVGDYYACARVCRVPAPPRHAVNRGILMEGLCSFMSGVIGCGHATSTFGGNIGAIGVSRVASRSVFIGTGILYILFSIFGKFSALFITIPYPVLGGAIVVMFGIFLGFVLSNLELTKMSSPRNMTIIGLSIFIGLAVPTWTRNATNPIQTGNEAVDKIIVMLLSSPNLLGTIIACFLDNTVPGSLEDRGISVWQVGEDETLSEKEMSKYNGGYEIYAPIFPKRLLQLKIMRYIPFLPYRQPDKSNVCA